jgi:hypothetical protein
VRLSTIGGSSSNWTPRLPDNHVGRDLVRLAGLSAQLSIVMGEVRVSLGLPLEAPDVEVWPYSAGDLEAIRGSR